MKASSSKVSLEHCHATSLAKRAEDILGAKPFGRAERKVFKTDILISLNQPVSSWI